MPRYFNASRFEIYNINGNEGNFPQYVYYYCSVETFLSIIQNSSLRLSNIEKSNDSNEINYFCDKLINTVNDWIYVNKNKFGLNEFNNINANDIEEMRNCIGKYACCFTENGDDIHMWREYGDHGKGIAIKLALRPLFDLYSEDSKFIIGKVSYNTDIIDNKLKEHVASTIKTCNSEETNKCLYDFIRNCINAATFFKQAEHAYEKEWRLLYNPFGNIMQTNFSKAIDIVSEVGTQNGQTGLLNFSINPRCGDIKSYFEYDFSGIKDNLIQEIILGHNCTLRENDVDLLLLLKTKGYDINTKNKGKGINISRSSVSVK